MAVGRRRWPSVRKIVWCELGFRVIFCSVLIRELCVPVDKQNSPSIYPGNRSCCGHPECDLMPG